MGCLLVLLAAFAPRLIVVFAWIARPVYFDAVFDTWIFPSARLIFLPFTTLIWLLVGAPPQGVEGLDWLWVVLAVFLDLSHYANTYEQRDTVSAAWEGTRPHRPQRPRRTGDAPGSQRPAGSSRSLMAPLARSCQVSDRFVVQLQHERRSRAASAQDHAFAGAGRLRVGQARHPEPVDQPDQPGEQGNDQRHLKRERSGIRVDADDLRLHVLGLADEQLLELRVAHHLGVVVEPLRDLLLFGRREHRTRLRQVREGDRGVASMIAPANASPNDNERSAEFTPAASLTRSSEIGDSV